MGIRVCICLNIYCLFNVQKYKPPIKKSIQQKYSPSKPQYHCANNTAASAFRTREQNTQRGTSSSPRAWTLISKQPNELRKMLKIYFPRVHWHFPERVIQKILFLKEFSETVTLKFGCSASIRWFLTTRINKKCLTLCNSVVDSVAYAENRYKYLLHLRLLTQGPVKRR